jgi:hypothetical protein
MPVVQSGYVVRSGYGFLKDPATGEMVANRSNPDAAVFEAKRYATESEAESDAAVMRERGLEAIVVSVEKVPYTSA